MRPRRAACAALALAFVWAAQPATTSASIIVYTLLATPLTATADQVTAFNMTLTNVVGPDQLGCLEVELPAEYEIHSVSDPVASSGQDWSSSWDGNTVVVHANGGGGRLKPLLPPESATFTIVARPKEAGLTSWSNHAHRNHNCNDSEAIGLPVEVIVLIPLLPTPTPVPTPTPTPHPTPKPTQQPTSVPTPTPAATPGPVFVPPRPPDAPPSSTPTQTPTATASPTPRADRSPSIDGAGTPALEPSPAPSDDLAPPPAPSDGSDAGAVQVAFDEDGAGTGSLAIAAANVLAGVTVFAVPAAVLGGPGLLLILFVVLQAVGALGWLPAVRRLRAEDSRRA